MRSIKATARDESTLITQTAVVQILSGLLVLGFGVMVAYLGGIGGLLTGVVVLGLWFVFGTPAAIASGTVGIGIFVSPTGGVLWTALAFVPLCGLLVTPTLTAFEPRRFMAGTGLLLVGIGGASMLALQFLPLWLAASGILAVLGLSGYALHRLLLLNLGLLTDDAETATEYHGDETLTTS